MLDKLIQEKLKKLEAYRKKASPYPSRVKRDVSLDELTYSFSRFQRAGKQLYVVGRVMGWRDQGKIIFADIRDGNGAVQLVIKEPVRKEVEILKKAIDIGDIVEVQGKPFITKRGEKSVDVSRIRLISKSLKPWPSSWFGIENIEERHRRRYLDFIYNKETKRIIVTRSHIITEIRSLLIKDGFMEVETPTLQPIPGGALAEPFATHFNALDLDMYLRIAPELYLKRLLVGGFEKIFEIGKNFRNEGIDRDHYPEFTMMELYWAYQNYEGLMKATEQWLKLLIKNLGIKQVMADGKKIKFQSRWQTITFEDTVKKYSPRDIKKLHTPEIDDVFKKKIRPHFINPVFVIDHPKEISPLAKPKEDSPQFVERFQLVIGGKELVNGFSELNDPIDQRERMEEQERMHRAGDKEASRFDEDFLEALEYGMPPAAGLGIGIDRLAALITDTRAIRDTITFTTLRPK